MTDPKISVLDATTISKDAFMKLWKIEGSKAFPDHDVIFPKSPGHATNMYNAYWKRYLEADQNEREVMAVEESFSIDLAVYQSELPAYIGRIDLIWAEKGNKISIVDHKTSKALYPISLTSYEMSLQTDGYMAAGSMFYNSIPTMIYNIHLCQKSKIDFHRYFINKRRASLEQFIEDLLFYSDGIITDLSILEHDLQELKNRNDNIRCFKRRPGTACTTFMKPCRYKEICSIRNNPLLWMNKPPQGFTINEWKPDEHEAELKQKLSEV